MNHIVDVEEAQAWLSATGSRGPAYSDLAHTVVVQAEQIAAVLAIHGSDHQCLSRNGALWQFDADRPCPTARALGVDQ